MKYEGEIIGKIIKQEREKRNMTQAQLAKKLFVTNKQVSNYEKGKPMPPLDKLLDLCDIFDCELGFLLGEEIYENETRIMTETCRIIGLEQKSVESLIKLTSDKFSKDENRRVINLLLKTPMIESFISDLTDVDRVVSEYEMIDKQLEKKFGKDMMDAAWEAYHDLHIDYQHDEEYQREHPELCQVMAEFDQSIDQKHDLQYSIDVARYSLNKTMEALIDEMFPLSEYRR